VANRTNLKTLGFTDPLRALQKRCPEFVSKYADEHDEFGFKIETFARYEPFFRFFYEDYFKVEVRGLENVPKTGAALFIGNHSGLLPIDAGMLAVPLLHNLKPPRRVRYLVTDWFFSVPGVETWITETGNVRATLENAEKLVDKQELVGIYPEGLRGVGKAFKERYRVIDFHPGFVQLAIARGTPIVPVATVGGDEIYPNLINLKEIARLIKMPFFPILPTFPWLPFPLYFFPLPVRWLINIHQPIHLHYPREKASDRKLCLRIAREIQYMIQRDLNNMLRERKSVFTGWDPDDDS
jgi:1-acyl-sn-glycerol-3-phosphate acyltransferase